MQSLVKRKIAYIHTGPSSAEEFVEKFQGAHDIIVFYGLKSFLDNFKGEKKIEAIVIEREINSEDTTSISLIKSYPDFKFVPIVVIIEKINTYLRKLCLNQGVSDLFSKNFIIEDFLFRLDYLILRAQNARKTEKEIISYIKQYKVSTPKRLFDIFFSLLALLLLSPLILIISIAIKIESRGPVFYSSKRVGTGYKIFDFYKFRSMSQDADKKIKELFSLNQYKKDAIISEEVANLCSECIQKEVSCQSILYHDGETICEKMHKRIKKQEDGATFIKFKGDPRITVIGHFIRNTSIDELPQLLNVLKGDMSIVGNRPLPLYEAEKVTTDKYITRFMAPAGITGLWQVSKRGKGKMSEEERIELDNIYAMQHSFWGDIKIILKTIPALLQKENV